MSRASTKSEVQLELEELRRKYRMMEGDRRSYSDESQASLRKQKAMIDKLDSENEHLRSQLGDYSRTLSVKESKELASRLNRASSALDDTTRDLDGENRRVEELRRLLKGAEMRSDEVKKSEGGVYAEQETMGAVQNQVKMLENRLDKQLVKFNEALSVNRKLRQEIDNLRQERVVFDGIYKRLERELHEKKKQMANVIEVSNISYEERDQAQNEHALLKQQGEKELEKYDEEFRRLEKSIEQDRRMKEFLKVRERGKVRSGAGKDDDHLGNLSMEQETKVKRRVARGHWAGAKDKASAQQTSERAQSYKEAVEKIKGATGIEDLDELVDTFVAAEDQSFSLFNFVNELNNEIERLEEQVNDLQQELDLYRGQGASSDAERKKMLKDLEDLLSRTEARSEQYETMHNEAVTILEQLREGIQSVFDKIGCDAEAMVDMLGTAGVTEGNMMQHLGVIEQRTNELLQLRGRAEKEIEKDRKEKEEEEEMMRVVASKKEDDAAARSSLPVSGVPVAIIPPSTGEDFLSEDEVDFDDEERPLTREELKARTTKMLGRQEKSNVASSGKRKSRRKE